MRGVGLAGHDFTPETEAVANKLKSAVSGSLTLYTTGINAMAGLSAGIRAGTGNVISAMRTAARAALNAAKAELQIRSPSRVFRDEIGAMTMRGFGEGVLTESKAQAKIIQNAARYLTGEAKVGSISTTSNDNRRTYDQSSSVSLSGNAFYVRSEQDITALATEIAALTKRRQRGRGLRTV